MSAKMIDWLYGLQHFGVKLGLHNIRALLRVLEHPESAFPSILLAGTNGKGSVAVMTEAILRASGLGTGMFTSPHLVRPNERIRLDGREIESTELDELLTKMRDTIAAALDREQIEAHPSFFEVITATALQAFHDHKVDAALLEVGLGGRLDATNAVEADLAVIVTVGLDHTKTLGETLAEIAAEKAGIVKPGKPVVSGVEQPEALAVLQQIARERDARWIDARAEFELVPGANESFALTGRERHYPELRLSLPGRHQWHNARVAVTTAELFADLHDLELTPESVRCGLRDVRWPGRLQWVPKRNGSPRILLDAAHNAAAMQALVAYLRAQPQPPDTLVFGATRGKPLHELLGSLSELAPRLVITRPPVDKGLDPLEVAEVARPLFGNVEICADPEEALHRGREWTDDDGYLLVTGSLYLIGEVLGLLEGGDVPGPVPF